MLQENVKAAWEYGRQFLDQGKTADYIPELGKADPSRFGICVRTTDGQSYEYGDTDFRFTMQSISKIVSLAAALERRGFDDVFNRVMMEPSGDSFNSILKLDMASNRPFNPMINAGAIAVTDLLTGDGAFDELLGFVRSLCMDDGISMDEAVYHSEILTCDRNRSIGFLLKSKAVLHGDVMQVVDLYTRMCSLSVTARSLAGLALVLAAGGINPKTGTRLLQHHTVRVIKTLMFTCGMYDRSGEFAIKVGLPCKSGVGGGIMSCVENRMGIGTYGPALDDKGNSIGGGYALEYLSRKMRLHIFDQN